MEPWYAVGAAKRANPTKPRDTIVVHARQTKDAKGHRHLTFWWAVRGPNGKTLAASETYKTRRACRRSAGRFGARNGIRVVSEEEA